MLNYVKSECYRVCRLRGYWIFFACIAAIPALVNVMFWRSNEGGYYTLGLSVIMIGQFLASAGFLTIAVADMVFSNEYKNQTMKNTLAYGYSRGQIYFGKFITQVLFAFLIAGITFGLYLVSGFLLLENPPEVQENADSFLLALAGCVPLWLGCLALSNVTLFLIKSGTGASFAFVGLLMAPNIVFQLLAFVTTGGLQTAFQTARGYLLWNQFSGLISDWQVNGIPIVAGDLLFPTVVGLVHVAVILIIGRLLFKRKEL